MCSAEAKSIGGRLPEAHHYHFLKWDDGSVRMQYKYKESTDSREYLPLGGTPIQVTFTGT